MRIYFNEQEIEQDAYMSISNSYSLFSDTFFLGSTSSREYTVKLNKKYITNTPSNITLKEDNNLTDILEIDNITENDNSFSYNLTDKMLDFNFYYDASEIIKLSEKQSVTLLEILKDICLKANVELGIDKLENDIDVTWFDNEITAREYISYIAELQASYAYIDEKGILCFSKHKKPPVKTIDFDLLGDYKIGEYHYISRVVYEMGAIKYEFGEDAHNTLYIRDDNPFIINAEQIEYIYNNIVGFEFYSFETTKCPLYDDVKVGDIITFSDGINEYPTIAQYTRTYNGKWTGSYKLSIKSTKQENTEYKGLSEKYKRLKITVNRDLNMIKQEVGETQEAVKLIELFRVDLETNNIIVQTDESNKPYETTTYTVDYKAFYLNQEVDITPTTKDVRTGIEVTINEDSIVFGVDKDKSISLLDNKFLFEFEYTDKDGKNYTVSKTVVLSIMTSKTGTVQSDTEPDDETVLWYDTTNNQLKRYDTNEWIVVNDYSTDINNIKQNVDELNNVSLSELNRLGVEIHNIQETLNTSLEQTANEFLMKFQNIQQQIDSGTLNAQDGLNEIYDYIRFSGGTISLGKIGNAYDLRIENDRIVIYYNNEPISSWIQNRFEVSELHLGNFAFIPRDNGSLSFRKVK